MSGTPWIDVLRPRAEVSEEPESSAAPAPAEAPKAATPSTVPAPAPATPAAPKPPAVIAHTKPTMFHRAPLKTEGERDLSFGEAVSEAARNLPASAGEVVGSFAHAITHPGDTLSALGGIGTGIVSKGAGAIGVQQDKAEKEKSERFVNAMWDHYKKTYFTSWDDFKRAFAKDPAGILMDFSTFTGAGAAAMPAKAARVAKLAATVTDPIQLGLSAARGATKGAVSLGRGAQVASGTSYNVLKEIYDIGKSSDPEIRRAFNAANKGSVDAGSYADRIRDQLSKHYDKKAADFASGLAKTRGAPVANLTGVYKVINDHSIPYHLRIAGTRYSIDDARHLVNRSAAGGSDIYDQHRLKKELDRLANKAPTIEDANAVRAVRNALADSMSVASPEYGQLMRQYQTALGHINDFKRYVTGGDTMGGTARLLKGLNSLSSKEKAEVLKAFSKDDKTIIPTLAGLATRDIWRGGGTGVAEGLAAAASGLGLLPLVHPATAAGIALVSSPKLAAKTQYTLGRAAPYAAAATSRPVTSSAYYGERALQEEGQSQAPEETEEAAPAETKEPSLFDRLLGVESSTGQFDKEGKPVISPKGAVGAAQVLPSTGPEAAEAAGEEWSLDRLHNDADYNMRLGNAYLQKLLNQFGGDERLALAAYNAGPNAIRKILNKARQAGADWEDFIPDETKNYLKRITGSATGGRIQRASGGRIMNHAAEASRLVLAAEKAKKSLGKQTESLLGLPDDHIAKALSIANESV